MTSDEIKVVIAAAVVFVVINIIMWSVIAAVNRGRRRKNSPPTAPVTVPVGASGERIVMITPGNEPEIPPQSQQPPLPDTKPDASFRVTETTLIVHTDERL